MSPAIQLDTHPCNRSVLTPEPRPGVEGTLGVQGFALTGEITDDFKVSLYEYRNCWYHSL